MIVDLLSNISLYPELSHCADLITAFAKKVETENVEDGRYELDGDNLFAMVQRYTAKPREAARMESHKLYADLQYVSSGVELIPYDILPDLVVEEDKTPAKDVIFYKAAPAKADILLTAGMFGYFAAQDGHMPKVAVPGKEDTPIVKIVFKIRL